MSKRFISLALALTSVPSLAATAQAQLPESIAACARVQDAAERSACYDREVAAIRNAPPPPVAPSPPTAGPSQPKVVPAPTPPEFGEESVRKKGSQPERLATNLLRATITRVRQPLRGYYLVNLDNGQIWRQKDAKANFTLRVGDAISIRKETLGSYHLWADRDGSKNWVYVTRVR
jgi:hypothetical protein